MPAAGFVADSSLGSSDRPLPNRAPNATSSCLAGSKRNCRFPDSLVGQSALKAADYAPEMHVALASMGAVPYLAWCVRGLTPGPEAEPELTPYERPGMAVIA